HEGGHDVVEYLESLNYTEPAFVFAILVICSTRPILEFSSWLIGLISKAIPLPKPVAFYFTALTIGPLLGSFITEPAAMTVTALILLKRYYSHDISKKLMYATIGLLFVNVSIGGTLTPFAAPPVLMVAGKWNWDFNHMITHFGWKSALAIFVSTAIVTAMYFKELTKFPATEAKSEQKSLPLWITALHLLALALVVMNSHHMVVFIGVFLFFLGVATVTQEYQDSLKVKEGLLVGLFLGGLVTLGGPQRWWLEPLLGHMDALPLFLGSTALTAITDNAALTYLGSQVPDLSELSKYALVAGAVTGGGLTVIANAPNPAGYGILNKAFGEEGISPLGLLMSAAGPTVIAAICLWLL
ncbi:MAG: putative Na+/H+ antiporter, partial [Bdellovibrionales bacterium]|nr:putative Na+/H+ antiporter [Bdellovibrionales bacterium]